MKKKYQNIFFDLDGTISNSYKGIENGINFALDKLGVNAISPNEIKSMIGKPLTESLKKYCQNDLDKTAKAIGFFREYYALKGVIESELYPNMYELLARASKFHKLFVITAKPTVYAVRLLEFQNVAQFFSEIKGCQLDSNNFKKSDLMLSINNYKESLMIGDKREDIEAGREVGIRTCGVLYGYGTKKEITEANPDFIVNSVNELNNIINY